MDSLTTKVLVTGAAGWLGSRLAHALVRGLPDCRDLPAPWKGPEIRCLLLPGQDARPLTELSSAVSVHHGDLRDPEDCRRFCAGAAGGLILHAAAVIHPRRVAEFYQVNVEGTKNLLGAAADAGVRRVVAMSSNSPCGSNPRPDHLFDENSPYRPYLHYGRSKMQMELAVKGYSSAGRLETVVIRAPWFYGPNQPPRQSLFFRMIREGRAPIVGGGGNRRSMAYVDNVCQGILLAAQEPGADGRVYWIADERPYSMNEIVGTVEQLMEREFGLAVSHRRLRLPGLVSEAAWVIDAALQGLGLYQQKIHVLSEMNKTIACSIERARRELGYRPAVGLEEGMRRSIRWCLETGLRI